MRYPDIEHDGVTGSCHQLHMDAANCLLIDCGLFQGNEASAGERAGAGRLDIEFSLATVQALIVTHVHIDRVGRIRYLLAAGFKGPIFCSEPSAKLLPKKYGARPVDACTKTNKPRRLNKYVQNSLLARCER